jgi:hypothetical protein
LTSYSIYVNDITPKWGYLVTGSNPQPLWIGEFGTCNSADTCVSSSSSSNLGYWFNMFSSYVRQNNLDWSYWAINGTTESGNAGGFGTVEGYGVLNTTWNGSALASLTSRLQSMMTPGSANFSLIPGGPALILSPGGSGSSTVAIVPENGFTGTINLSCTVTSPTGASDTPTCGVPASVNVTSDAAVSATVSLTTTAAAKNQAPTDPLRRMHWPGRVALACGLLFAGSFTRRARRFIFPLAVLIASIGFAGFDGCGGGGAANSGGGSTGTTAGNYSVTVTGTAAGISPVNVQIALTVQ